MKMEIKVLEKDDVIDYPLPTELIEEINKRHKKDSLLSFLAWKYIFKKFKLNKDVKVNYNSKGKPYIDGCYFSISHSKDCVVVLTSDKECGIDIEYINKRKNFDLMAAKYLSDSEYNNYLSKEDKTAYFIKCWTIKEAYFKKEGCGIDLRRMRDDLLVDNSYIYTDKNNNQYYISYKL